MCLVSEHAVIDGNERADMLAKTATLCDSIQMAATTDPSKIQIHASTTRQRYPDVTLVSLFCVGGGKEYTDGLHWI